jgi:hypothetical protein
MFFVILQILCCVVVTEETLEYSMNIGWIASYALGYLAIGKLWVLQLCLTDRWCYSLIGCIDARSDAMSPCWSYCATLYGPYCVFAMVEWCNHGLILPQIVMQDTKIHQQA